MSRKRHSQWTLLCFVLATSTGVSTAFASAPSLSLIMPRGCQRDAETVLTFRGARLSDAKEVFFYEPGIETVKLEVKNDKILNVTVNVSDQCRLGQHVAQVRTASGISDFRSFYVGPFPNHPEKEPNSDFESPQEVPLNVTVTGVVQNEDVDYFAVNLKKGQRLSAEIEGMRLGTTLFDPYVAILDAKRFELAAADDTPLVWQDAVASIVAPQDGRYVVLVRESAYGGGNNCNYRLHIGSFPRPIAVYPAGGKLGDAMDVRLIGDAAGEFTQKINLPSEMVDSFEIEPRQGNDVAPSPSPFRLSEYGNVLEAEPNNQQKQATPAELPLALNGIIATPGDVDFFKFQGKKGQVLDVECYARRVRSELDPVMNIYRADGRSLAGNDDSRGLDSYIRFTVPADGEYAVRITDHLSRGGAGFVYRVELTPPRKTVQLGIPRVARYSQDRQWIAVPRGNRFATLISARRANFGGELALDPKDLPAGLTMHAQPMASNLGTMPVVIEAAADAPIEGNLVDLIGRHVDPKQNISGHYSNTADFIRGGPGQSIYWTCDVNRLAVAVVDEIPFHLEIVQPKAPIVRNGSMRLKVVAHKKEGWDEPIAVQFPFRPPGIGATTSVQIPKGKNEVEYPLSANDKAQLNTWPVYVIGSANVNGNAWAASQMASLEVAEPFVTFEIQRTATEQGQPTEIVCKINHNRPFQGTAKARLVGLPAKTTVPELDFNKDTAELVFPVTTAKDSPAGNHKNIICQVTVTDKGEPVIHSRVGVTELRIDKPAPPKVAAKPQPKPAAKKAAAPKPAEPKPVRLTRLQKLRLEAKQRREVAGTP